MNPTFSENIFIPDAEAHVMPDGRLYVYGSLDNSGDSEFCSTKYLTFSTDDMLNWQAHGEIFSTEGQDPVYQQNSRLTIGAPDCIHYEGTYYLYYCTYGNGMGVANSSTPQGPFAHLGYIQHADGDSIDPAVFIDDDGTAYYYWGQFQLKGARLNGDMCSLDLPTLQENLLTEHEHGFHEGASVRKIKGRYYVVYTDISRGRATCLSYAVGDSPLGPFKKQGVIIDNIGCDPETWNNHGSIEYFQDELYVFYHRSSQNSIYNRRMCIEKLAIDEEGRIEEAAMTSSGVWNSLPATARIAARRAQRLKAKLPFDHVAALRIEPRSGKEEVIAYTRANDWAEFGQLAFTGAETEITIEAACMKDCLIEIWTEGSLKIGEVIVENTGSWQTFAEFTGTISHVYGSRKIWLLFKAHHQSVGRLADISSFYFH